LETDLAIDRLTFFAPQRPRPRGRCRINFNAHVAKTAAPHRPRTVRAVPMSPLKHSPAARASQPVPLAALLHWIDQHLWETLGWPELMRASGLDHPALLALFNKHLDTTPMTWIRKRRELMQKNGAAPTRRAPS